jgi:hypothetical protein
MGGRNIAGRFLSGRFRDADGRRFFRLRVKEKVRHARGTADRPKRGHLEFCDTALVRQGIP